MTYVETRMNVWEALAGRAPGEPVGPADPDLWGAVVDRLDPTRARPVLRAGVEAVELTGVRGSTYVMLRSPDDGSRACYLRLTPEEWQLALLMDGSCTVARLVAEFARLAGRLAPDQVRRVVADLAGNRMLEDLPGDAFRSSDQGVPALPVRIGTGLLSVVRGRRMLVADVDRVVTALYRGGARFLFTRVAAVLMAILAVAGFALFTVTWFQGSAALFLTGESYLLGAVVLLLLNAVALICHEAGHALATKHAGREVPAAGFLVYFGLPSVFVDTTDAWMAGRRARILVTAAGPLTGLVLAGALQVVGFAVPAVAPIAFKLAFVWYLNTLFHLNPFLALDGSYLLMDWLEIPNLRARGVAWVTARLRGRPPRWSGLDREGRIIALYGILAVLWLAVAANVVYRIWSDRLSGLATGLWHDGAGGKVLLLLVLLGLSAPVCYLGLGWLVRRGRTLRIRARERDREADQPRRLAALRAGDLGGLPQPALAALASRARWLHPRTGEQIVLAGGSPTAVYVVVEGALQARQHGDPGGTIRHHVGPGGVVGLADALTGRSTTLNWHTAGTTLLAVPTAAVATVVGPLPGPPPADRAEAEALFAETPALAGLGVDEQLALIASAHPVDLGPGAPVSLPGPTHAVIVESGVIAMPDGTELRRGTLVGPVGDGSPGEVARTRTPARLWVLPDASQVPPLVGSRFRAPVSGPAVPAPAPGIHPTGVYPPLAAPPGPPDGTGPDVDRRFARRMWWLVVLVLLLALSLTAVNLRPGPAWAEMPADRVLLSADQGLVRVTAGGTTVRLAAGERRYVEQGARIVVGAGGLGRLTFPGGAAALLCAGAETEVGRLRTQPGRERAPEAALAMQNGRVLADTASTSGAFRALALVIGRPSGDVTSTGDAWYAADPATVTVSAGRVSVAGAPVDASDADLSCGDGVAVAPPAAVPSESPSAEPPPGLLPSESPSALPSVEVSPSVEVTTAPPTTTAPPRATTRPPRTVTPAPRPTTSRPPIQPAPPPSPSTAVPSSPAPSTPPSSPPPPPPPSAQPPSSGASAPVVR